MFSFFKKKSPPPAPDRPQASTQALVKLPDQDLPSKASGAPIPRSSWLARLKQGLQKTGSSIAGVFTGTRIDEALYEDLESALLMADTGVKATEFLLADLKRRVKEARATEPAAVKALLVESLTTLLTPLQKPLLIGQHKPTVVMVAGVNGAGKTTSIGKLTHHLAQEGASVLLAAADTFRAAAREQLGVWAERNTVEIISQEGGDPAAVSFDAVSAGRARGRDVVLVDTAGRLPTQLHLMEELKKIKRVIQKADASAPHEALLVIDGNTGQNALAQVRAFDDALQLTGLIVTKLDGTAKGGVLAAADTFRAAAREQLGVWAERNTVEIISQEGGDPAAVSFDAVSAGRARGRDVVLVDTAGRLPTQLHLMEELKKIKRVIQKADASAPHAALLVIDGNTGQNALAQVRAFDDALQLTGLIVTKLDGTAKGGVLAAIARERPIPVYFIGVGEQLADLETFNAREFAQALLS